MRVIGQPTAKIEASGRRPLHGKPVGVDEGSQGPHGCWLSRGSLSIPPACPPDACQQGYLTLNGCTKFSVSGGFDALKYPWTLLTFGLQVPSQKDCTGLTCSSTSIESAT
jgi:hypothetical protein